METLDPQTVSNALPFNSPTESAIRSMVLLNACYPKNFDLRQLVWLNYLVVHTADIGGPLSLHPPLPDRGGELLVCRPIVEDGLLLLRRLHYVEIVIDEEGVGYRASESAAPFVSLLRSTYSVTLLACADWVARVIEELGFDRVRDRLVERLGRWPAELTTRTAWLREAR